MSARADVLAPADWTFPVPIHYGPGRFAELGATCRRVGMTRPLVVTDRGSRDLPFITEALDRLAAEGMTAALYAEVAPNPTEACIAAGKAVYEDGGHDGVVAIGGGSGMDGGKAVSLVAGRETDLWAFDYDDEVADPGALPFPPLVTVPTTSGTGAETESTAMVTDTRKGIKRCVWHPVQKPAAAILDPALTLGLPRNLTAWTGCDALVHAIEALSAPGFNPLCDGLAVEAMRLIGRALPAVHDDPSDLTARGEMLMGSCLAGIAFLKGLGLVHAISHMVGAVYDTQHGLTNAVLLPAVMRFNAPALGEKTAVMAQALGCEDTSFEALDAHVCALLDRLDIPRGLADLGVGDNRIAEIAQKAHGDAARATNPVDADPERIAALIRIAMTDGR